MLVETIFVSEKKFMHFAQLKKQYSGIDHFEFRSEKKGGAKLL